MTDAPAERDDEMLLISPGRVTRLTLNRPAVHNAINARLGERLVQALDEASLDPAVKVIVIDGAGPSFCSGDDRNEGPEFHNPDIEAVKLESHGYFQLMRLMRRSPKAIVCAVHGYCLGSAMDLLLAADFAVVDAGARLGMVFGDRGIGPAGTVFLPRFVGVKQTNRLMFDREFLSPVEARALGLITEVAPAGQLAERVRVLVDRLAEGGERYYAYFGLVKDAVNRTLFSTLEDDIRMQTLMTRLSDFYRLAHPAPHSGAE